VKSSFTFPLFFKISLPIYCSKNLEYLIQVQELTIPSILEFLIVI